MTFIVAELSANHHGSLERALKIINAAADAQADAVKFQVYTPDMAIPYPLTSGSWAGKDLRQLYQEAQTPWEWLPELFQHTKGRGLIPFASPFSNEAVDYLETLNCPIYKIASFELVDLDLVRYASATGKEVILSTGMANEEEIESALMATKGASRVTLLVCSSSYPAESVNLNLIPKMAQYADIGLSDHTLGIGVSVAAVALGATVIEKHLTLDDEEGPDSAFSMRPHEFTQLVKECRRVEGSLGDSLDDQNPSRELRRSLYYTKDLPKGTVIAKEHLKTMRPALGLSPLRKDELIGQVLKIDVNMNDPVK